MPEQTDTESILDEIDTEDVPDEVLEDLEPLQDNIVAFLIDVRRDKAKGTFEARKTDLRAYNEYLDGRGLDVTGVEKQDVHQFLRKEGSKYADATVESRYWSVKTLYDYLAGIWDLMEETPFEELSPKNYSGNGKSKQTEADLVYVTPEEVDLMANNVADPKLRNEAILRLLFQTGMRRQELRSAKLENVDRDNRSIMIQDAKDPEKHREVHYQPSLDFLMQQWIEVYRDSYGPAADSPYLFVTQRSEHLGDNRLSRIIRKAADEAGIQETLYEDAAGKKRYRVTAHAFRHGHAVEAVKSGIDIRRLQLHMGHEKLETTQQYLEFLNRDVADAMSLFGTRPDDREP